MAPGNETSNSRTRLRKTFPESGRNPVWCASRGWFPPVVGQRVYSSSTVQNRRKLKESEAVPKYRGESVKSVERVERRKRKTGVGGGGGTCSREKSEKTNICRNSVRFMEAVELSVANFGNFPLSSHLHHLQPPFFVHFPRCCSRFSFPVEVFQRARKLRWKISNPSSSAPAAV